MLGLPATSQVMKIVVYLTNYFLFNNDDLLIVLWNCCRGTEFSVTPDPKVIMENRLAVTSLYIVIVC